MYDELVQSVENIAKAKYDLGLIKAPIKHIDKITKNNVINADFFIYPFFIVFQQKTDPLGWSFVIFGKKQERKIAPVCFYILIEKPNNISNAQI